MNFKLGKIIGIPISVDASWFIIFALIVFSLAKGYFPEANPGMSHGANWLAGIIAALLLFASVLLHELAHSVVAKRNGLGISGITLFIFGGVSRLEEEPNSPDTELKMAIAGPATSFALSAVFYMLKFFGGPGLLGPLGAEIVGYLAMINLALGVFNLLPGFPLDGGRVFRAILWGVMRSFEKATQYAANVGKTIGYLMMFVGFVTMFSGGSFGGLWFVFIGWYMNNAAQQSYQHVIVRKALSGVDVASVMDTDFQHVEPETTVESFVHDYLLRHNTVVFPVSRGEELVGVITINEVRAVPRDQWTSTTVGQIARPPEEERIVDEKDDAFDALMQMAEGRLSRLLVMHDHKLKGMVTQESLLNLVRTKMQIGM